VARNQYYQERQEAKQLRDRLSSLMENFKGGACWWRGDSQAARSKAACNVRRPLYLAVWRRQFLPGIVNNREQGF
jgi:hypothetical protein